ncbi:MAG: hypothetical protein ACTSUE_14925 [Promethearchaeota archaeon]
MFKRKKTATQIFLAVSLLAGLLLFLDPHVSPDPAPLIGDTLGGGDDLGGNLPVASDITQNNEYTGTADSLSINEYGSTEVIGTDLSLSSGSPADASILVPADWDATQLDTIVTNLFETRERLTNGALSTGNNGATLNTYSLADGASGSLSASSYATNWVDLAENPAGGDNGGTYNMQSGWVDAGDTLYMSIDGRTAGGFLNYQLYYDNDTAVWWTQTVTFPRVNPTFAEFQFDIYVDQAISATNVEIFVGGNRIFSRGALGYTVDTWISDSVEFNPSYVDSASFDVTIGIRTDAVAYNRVWPTYAGTEEADQIIQIRDLSLIVTAEADPSDVGLAMTFSNDTDSRGSVAVPDGTVDTYSPSTPWSAGSSSPAQLNTTFTTTLPSISGYNSVNINVDQNITGYRNRLSQNNLIERNPGVDFTTVNDTDVAWDYVFFAQPPFMPSPQSDIYDYFFNMSIPTDWTLSALEDPFANDRTTDITGGGLGDGYIQVNQAVADTYGYWLFSANSPNYVVNLDVLEDSTGSYVSATSAYEGSNIRVDATIRDSTLTNGYVDQTDAILTVKYPNGTVFLTEQRTVAASRAVSFTPFKVPEPSDAGYVAGDFTFIVSWNNTYSGNPMNESGLATMAFTFKHNTTLTAVPALIDNVFSDETSVLMQVQYRDFGNFDITEPGTQVTFLDFTGANQTMTFQYGYYFFNLDATTANPGLNTLTIHAMAPSFESAQVNVQVRVITKTDLSVDEYPSLSVEWGKNFTLTLHYSNETSGAPITDRTASDVQTDWSGSWSADDSGAATGTYVITCNSSAYTPGSSILTGVNISGGAWEPQSSYVYVFVTPRAAIMNVIPPSSTSFGADLVIDFTVEYEGTGLAGYSPTARITSPSIINGVVVDLGSGNYQATIPTASLSAIGQVDVEINFTSSGVPYYNNISQSIIVNINNRASDLTYDPPAPVSYGETVTFDIIFSDGVNGSLVGDGVSLSFTDNATSITYNVDGNFTVSFDTSSLGSAGVVYISIDAAWVGGSPFYYDQSILVKITVQGRESELTYDSLAPTPYLENITFNVNFNDGINSSGITGATILTNGTFGWSEVGGGVYSITINTTTLANAIGSNWVQINASIAGAPFYTPQSIVVKTTTIERPTTLTYDSLAPTAVGEDIVFNINCLDAATSAGVFLHITVGANVSVSDTHLGNGVFEITIPAGTLNIGTHPVDFTFDWDGAQPDYYADNSITINIVVTGRPVQMTYSGVAPTSFGGIINFELNVADGINGSLIGGIPGPSFTSDSTFTIVESGTSGIYSVSLNTTENSMPLGNTNYWFHVVAGGIYGSTNITITFTVTNRATQLLLDPASPVQYGEDFILVVQYIDGVNGTGLTGRSGDFDVDVTAVVQEMSLGYYNITIDSEVFGAIGTFGITINVTWPGGVPYYDYVELDVNLRVLNRQSSFIVDQVDAIGYGENFTIDVSYTDAINSSGIDGTITTSNVNAHVTGSAGVYQIHLNSTYLSVGTTSLEVNITYPSATAPFYTNGTTNVTLTVLPRGATLTVEKESNVQFGENISILVSFEDSVNGSLIDIPIGDISVTIVGYSNVSIVGSGTGGTYTFKLDTNALPRVDVYQINVTTSWTGSPYYYNRSKTIDVTVSQRNTIFYEGGEVYQTYGYNVNFTVSLYYLDVGNGSTITAGANIVKTLSAEDYVGTNVPTVNETATNIFYNGSAGVWQIEFNSSHFGKPSAEDYVVTLSFDWLAASKPFYINQTTSFNISVQDAQTQIIMIGSTVAQSGNNHTLNFFYINTESGQKIEGATIKVNGTEANTGANISHGGEVVWNGTAFWNSANKSYEVSFDVESLPGDLHVFNITFNKTNYNTITYTFTLIDTALGSELVVYAVEGNRIVGQNVSILMYYKYQGSDTGITGATLNVSSNISSLYWALSEYNIDPVVVDGKDMYNLTILYTSEASPRINSSGFHQIYVTADSSTTTERTINVQFELKDIPTIIDKVYFNGTDNTASPTNTTQITKSLNITIEYNRLFPSAANITDADVVYVTSSSLASDQNFTYGSNQYQLVLPMTDLGIGTHFLFVIAQRTNHQQASVQLEITVTQVATDIRLFLNGTENSSISVIWGQFINITAYYNNTIDDVPLTDVQTTVSLSGGSGGTTSWNLATSGSNWTIDLNSGDLGGPASYTMTISASRPDYQTATQVFSIQVVEVPTSLTSPNNSQISVNWSETFTVYLNFSNYLGAVIAGATISPSPVANISGSFDGSYYLLEFDSADFGTPKIYSLILSASLSNRSSQSVTFSIDIKNIPTSIETFEDAGPSETVFNVYWGDTLTITVQYEDLLNNANITGAGVSAGDKNASIISFTYSGGNYSIVFNSTTLGAMPTTHIISLTMSKQNYTSGVEVITINVLNIPTAITSYDSDGNVNTSMAVLWGDVIVITANVNRTDRGPQEPVTGATLSTGTVTSVIVDLGNGNYTITIDSVDLGTPKSYTFVLSAIKTNHTSSVVSITIQVIAPATEIIVTNSTGSVTTNFNIFYGQTVSFNLSMNDTDHDALLDGWSYSASLAASSDAYVNPNWNVTYDSLTPGIYSITISASRANYTSSSTSITIVVESIPTELITYEYMGAENTTFVVEWGTNINITVAYNDTYNGLLVDPATATIISDEDGKLVAAPHLTADNATFEFDSMLFTPGVHTIIFSASKLHHDYASVAISLEVQRLDASLVIFNNTDNSISTSFEGDWGDLVSFDISYNETGGVPLATIGGVVTLNPVETSRIASTYAGRLNVSFDTSSLSPGIHTITVTAEYTNRTSRSTAVTLTVNEVATQITPFNSTGDQTVNFAVYWNEAVDIDIMYNDTDGTSLTPTATILSSPITYGSIVASATPGRMTLTYNTGSLSPALYQITISANITNYQIATVVVFLTVMQRPTELKIYDMDGAENYSYDAYYGDTVSINVEYNDTLASSSITNDGGTVIDSSPLYDGIAVNASYRTLSFDSSALGVGLQSITIDCSLTNYTSKQVVILVNVLQVPTELTSYNFTTNLTSTSFKAIWGNLFNIAIEFNRTHLEAQLAGATVVVDYPYESMVFSGGKYVFTFNSSNIGPAALYSLTFTASLANFVTQVVSVSVDVLRVDMTLDAYEVNGPESTLYTVEWGKNLTFVLQYYEGAPGNNQIPDSLSNDFPGMITNATGNMTAEVNASSFGGTGIFTTTFIATMENRTTESLLVTIQVVELDARLNIYLNSTADTIFDNITDSKQYYANYKNEITIRVQYLTTELASLIDGALINIRFIEGDLNWTNNPTGNNSIVNASSGLYELTLNTTRDLGDYSQYSFVINIYKENYTLESEPFYVYPLKLQTRLDLFDSNYQLINNTGQKFTINYTETLVIYAALYSLSDTNYIATATYNAILKGSDIAPFNILPNGTAEFRFNSNLLAVDVGTSNFISLSGEAGFFNPSGNAINLEVLDVPTNMTVYNSTGGIINPADTISLVYTDTFGLNVTYTDTLNIANLTAPAVTVEAKIYTSTVAATFVGDDKWELLFDSTTLPVNAGSTPQVIISASYENYTTATFSFNLALLEAPTNMTLAFWNGTGLEVIGPSLTRNWSSILNLSVVYWDTFNTVPKLDASAEVKFVFGISPTYTEYATFTGVAYDYDLDTSLLRGGLTHQIIVTAKLQNFTEAEYRFNLNVLEVPTEVKVFNDTRDIISGETLQVVWGESITLNLTYTNLITNATVVGSGPTVTAAVFGTIINGTHLGGDLWTFTIDTRAIPTLVAGATPQVLVSANYENYSLSTFSFNLYVDYVPTNLTVYINGYDELPIPSSPIINQTILINATFTYLSNGSHVPGATVVVRYRNDSAPNDPRIVVTLNEGAGYYWANIYLDPSIFYYTIDIAKKLEVEATLPNYDDGYSKENLYIQPIEVEFLTLFGGAFSNETQNLLVEPGAMFSFRIRLNDTETGDTFTQFLSQIIITAYAPDLGLRNETEMVLVAGQGATYSIPLDFPSINDREYTLIIRIFVPPEFRNTYSIESTYIEVSFHAFKETGGIPPAVVWALVIALIALIAYFIAYQIRFKYPKIIRKIHDLQRGIRRGKKASSIKEQKVASREENIYGEYSGMINKFSFLQTSDTKFAAKTKGYAPTADETIELDFGIAPRETPAVEPPTSAAPVTPVAIGPKTAKALEAKAAPSKVPKPATPGLKGPKLPKPVSGPKAPGLPKLPKPVTGPTPGLPKPKALPVPAAKVSPVAAAQARAQKPVSHEGLYAELVKLEQKKYKAERSLRDLNAKFSKGILSEEEYKTYKSKFEEALEKIKENINAIRRQLVSF